jgi:hypothetical protein
MLLTVSAAAAMLCGHAQATAFASVQVAYWQVDFAYYFDGNNYFDTLPDGVTLDCVGAASDGSGGCISSASLSVTLPGSKSLDWIGGITLTNNTDADIPGFFSFNTAFSSFNPGGPMIGASVDDPATQFASYFSEVSGPGVFDMHGCDTDGGGVDGLNAFRTANACGVGSPDFSESSFGLGPLSAGDVLSANYEIKINVTAEPKGIPEPLTLTIFGVGLLGVAAARRRRGD